MTTKTSCVVQSSDIREISLEPLPTLDALEPVWKDLDHRGTHSFFVTWTWIGTWLRLIPWDFTPRLLTLRKAGVVVAAALVVPRRDTRRFGRVRQLHFNSTGEAEYDCITIEHNGFARSEVDEEALWRDFLQCFVRKNDADELVIPGMSGENNVGVASIVTLLRSARTVPAFRIRGLKELADTGLQPWLTRNSRQRLRRSMRYYLQHGPFRVEEARTVEEAQSFFSALKALHIQSWIARGKHHAFRYPFFEEFHRALITSGLPNGSIQLMRFSAGDRVIGYLYNFCHGQRIYAYQSGFDHSDRAARPGYVSHALAIEHAARKGAESYDFLAGKNQLKQTFADEDYRMRWCTFRQVRLRFKAEMFARSTAERLTAGSQMHD
jgi:CelD/BcsL family acetyltransferase involved in cellulose biosynthesis